MRIDAAIPPRGRVVAFALALSLIHLLLFFRGRSAAAGLLLLGIILPGLLAAGWMLRRTRSTRIEFVVLALAVGYSLHILVLYALTLLPGGLRGWQVIAAFDLIVLLLALRYARAIRPGPTSTVPEPTDEELPDAKAGGWAWAGLLAVVLVALLLRLPDLGYSELRTDEVRVLHRSAEVIQGDEDTLFGHRKGPAEILLPTGIYAVQQRIDEAQARVLFALANVLGLVAIYLLGWRLFGPVAGWAAAMLLAVDGYFVGFARFAQYQSLIIFLSAVIVLVLYRQANSRRPLPGYLWIAALCFVVGIYAHYEALWAMLPGLYLLWVYGRRTGDWQGLGKALAAPALTAAALILAFYLPFVLDDQWSSTAGHILGRRIGGDFPYNNLRDYVERTTIYSSSYQLFFQVIATLAASAIVLARGLPRWATRRAAGGVLGIGAAVLLAHAEWLQIGGKDHTWLLFAAAVAVMLVPARVTVEERTAWLWFGVPMVLSLFFIAEPNSHVYGFYLGWSLVIGSVVQSSWQALVEHTGTTRARRIALPLASALVLLFGAYSYLFFTYTQVEILRTWSENRPRLYWVPYALPGRDSLFGFPYKNGWKVVGMLYADGTLDAPFHTHESGPIGDWYSRGPYLCAPDAEYVMLPTPLEPTRAPGYAVQLADLQAAGYNEWGYVAVNGEPRLRILTTRPVDHPPLVYDEADYGPRFDRELSSPFFVKPGPANLIRPAQQVTYRLGDTIWLKGYTLAPTEAVPGDKIRLDLFWETTQVTEAEDKTFVQLIDLATLHKAAQRDSEPGCTRYSLDDWRAGDLTYDPYTLTIAPDTPPGTYTLLVGMYDEEERYPVFGADGAHLGDAVALATVEIRAPEAH